MTAPDIQRSVLDSLLDGVLVVGAGGRIASLNPAVELYLGLEPGEAGATSFAELFVAEDGYDAFTQLILDATLPGADPNRCVAEVRGGNGPRSISVATSYLRSDEGSSPAAVVAVSLVPRSRVAIVSRRCGMMPLSSSTRMDTEAVPQPSLTSTVFGCSSGPTSVCPVQGVAPAHIAAASAPAIRFCMFVR